VMLKHKSIHVYLAYSILEITVARQPKNLLGSTFAVKINMTIELIRIKELLQN
jgi:hypothetical protein